jgi:kinase-associated protein B
MMPFVKAQYKTGAYIGEKEEVKNGRALIKVLAVIKHPIQGDLHHPKQADVPFFQERKALSYGERTWVPEHTVSPYEGELPDYRTSLEKAMKHLYDQLQAEDSDFADKSIACLNELRKDYKLS